MKRWIIVLIIFILTVGGAVWLQSEFSQAREVILTVLGASIALGGTWLFKTNDREKAAKYLAIRVVCILDSLVDNCCDVVMDDGLWQGQRNQDGCLEPQVSIPDTPKFPDDVDWKSINHEMMYTILSLPSDMEVANKNLAAVWEYEASPPDFEEYFEERALQYAKIGLKAYDIACELRKSYGIPQKDYTDWDVPSELNKELKRIEKVQADRGARNEEMLSNMQKGAT